MAKTNDIIQAKEHVYMKEITKAVQNNSAEEKQAEQSKTQTTDAKFKEVVCPNVPTSYFKRAKKQKA